MISDLLHVHTLALSAVQSITFCQLNVYAATVGGGLRGGLYEPRFPCAVPTKGGAAAALTQCGSDAIMCTNVDNGFSSYKRGHCRGREQRSLQVRNVM